MASRVYTPPTCTLVVETPSSSLGGFSPQALIKPHKSREFGFALSFDDPRQNQDSITVKGDRSQLDRLYLVVNNYVQKLLAQPTLSPQIPPVNTQAFPPPTNTLHLQQQDFLHHRLYLGGLQGAEISVINLNTTQLFDLATALDTYIAEVNTAAPRDNWWKSRWVSSWGLATAAILLSVGLSSLGFRLLQLHNSAESLTETPQPSRRSPNSSTLQLFPIPKTSIAPLPAATLFAPTQKLPLPAPVQAPSGGVAPLSRLVPPPDNFGANSPLEVVPVTDQLNIPSPNSGNSASASNSSREGKPRENSSLTSSGNPPVSSTPALPNLPTLPRLRPEDALEPPPPEVPQISR